MNTATDALIFIALFLGLGYLSYLIAERLLIPFYLAVSVYLYHTLFCIYYWIYAQTNVADANGYYDEAVVGFNDWKVGSEFITSLTSLFAHNLGFSQLNTFLVYNLAGVIGVYIICHVFLYIWPPYRNWWRYIPFIIPFMPGINFWTSAIGKDGIAFLGAALTVYASLSFDQRKPLFMLGVILEFVVRPHVAAFMIAAAGIAFVTGRNIKMTTRVMMLMLSLGIAAAAVPFALDYAGVKEGGSISETLEKQSTANDGQLDLASMTLPEQLFAYLFRPLFFDARSALALVVSLENTFMLMLFFAFFIPSVGVLFKDSSFTVRYNLAFFVSALLLFAVTTNNLGIAIRQKTMILPAFLLLLAVAASIYYHQNQSDADADKEKTS
jgi:hypothetical protein